MSVRVRLTQPNITPAEGAAARLLSEHALVRVQPGVPKQGDEAEWLRSGLISRVSWVRFPPSLPRLTAGSRPDGYPFTILPSNCTLERAFAVTVQIPRSSEAEQSVDNR